MSWRTPAASDRKEKEEGAAEVTVAIERSRRRRLDFPSTSASASASALPTRASGIESAFLAGRGLPLRARLVARASLLVRRLAAMRMEMRLDKLTSMILVTSRAGTYAENLLAVTYTLSWMIVSSGLVMLNKHILSGLRFEFPLTLCSLGMLFSGIVSAVLFKGMGIGKEAPAAEANRVEPMAVPPSGPAATRTGGGGGRGGDDDAMSWGEYTRTILPIGLASSLTLYWGNYAYLFLSVSFIQMLKAFTPVVTMAVLFAFKVEHFRSKLIMSVVLMTLGTALASYGETNFSLVGFVSMAISEVMEALKLVAMQFLLAGGAAGAGATKQTRRKKFGLFEGLYYFAPATVLWLFVGITFTEGSRLVNEGGLRIMRENALTFALASVAGFGVNILTLGVVKTTSSLTYKVVGQVKNAFTVYFSILIFGNPVTSLQVLGYGTSIAGFLWYNKQKMETSGQQNAGDASAPVVVNGHISAMKRKSSDGAIDSADSECAGDVQRV